MSGQPGRQTIAEQWRSSNGVERAGIVGGVLVMIAFAVLGLALLCRFGVDVYRLLWQLA